MSVLAPFFQRSAGQILMAAILFVLGAVLIRLSGWSDYLRLPRVPMDGWLMIVVGADMIVVAVLMLAIRFGISPFRVLANLPRQPASLVWRTVSVLGLAAILVFFQLAMPWERSFDQTGIIWPLYHVFRLVFLGYLLLIPLCVGRWLSGFLGLQWAGIDRAIGHFFLGAATIQLLVFSLGSVYLIRFSVLAPLTLAVAFFAADDLRDSLRWFGHRLVSAVDEGVSAHLVSWFILGLVVMTLAPVILFRALSFIDHGPDAGGHYLPYLAHVLANGGWWPNDVWYHFYYSKGAGLLMWAACLTDLQAVQLITMSFVLATSAVVWSLTARITRDWRWGAVAVIGQASAFITLTNNFQKHHLSAAGYLLALIWLADKVQDRPWDRGLRIACMLLAVACVLLTTPSVGVILSLSVGCAIVSSATTSVSRAGTFWTTAAACIFTYALLLFLNWHVTGVADLTPFKLFFYRGDQASLAQWVSPYLLLLLDEASRSSTGALELSRLWQIDLERLSLLFRGEAFSHYFFGYPLVAFLVVVIAAPLALLKSEKTARNITIPAAAILTGAFLLSQVTDQLRSIERFFHFTQPIMAILGVGSIGLILSRLVFSRWPRLLLPIGGVLATCLAIWLSALNFSQAAAPNLRTFIGHLSGHVSPRQLYGSDITAECWDAQKAAGDNQAVVVFNLQGSACHLMPKGRTEIEISFSMGPRWHVQAFGTPDQAEHELRQQGINHFLVNLRGMPNANGCLTFSPLFSPDEIKRRFQVAWTNGDSFLLTWRNSDVMSPVTADFIPQWQTWRDNDWPIDWRGLCGRLAEYYRTQGENWPVRTVPGLAKLKGWQ